MQILTITMSKYLQEFNLMKRIQEERRVSATLEEQVEMNDIAINLIESFMQLFEVHIDISRFHLRNSQVYMGITYKDNVI